MKKLLLYPNSNKKTNVFLLMILLLTVNVVLSQSAGDYRSATNNTNWSSLASWVRYNGSTWVTPTVGQGYPGQNSGTGNVIIRFQGSITLDVSPANAIGSLNVGDGTTSNLGLGNNPATLSIGANTLIVNGNVVISDSNSNRDGILNNGSGIFRVGGSIIGNGTYISGTGTVEYYGAGLTPFPTSYYNLILSGSGVKAISSAVTITNNLSISGTTANLSAGTTFNVPTLTLGGSGTNTGTWGSTSSTATYKNNTYFAASTGRINVTTYTSLTPTVNAPTVGTYSYNGNAQGPDTTTNSGTGTSYTFSYVGVSGTTYGPSATKPTNAGNYTVTATVLDSADGFYRSSSSSATSFTIDTIPLSITVDNNTKVYGVTQNSPQTGSTDFGSSGLLAGESIGSVTLTYGSGALAGSAPVGSTSTITPSAATGGTFLASNYDITYVTDSGTLTVVTAPLTITADDAEKCSGTTYVLGTTAFTSVGLQNSETIGSVTLTSSGADIGAAVGPYAIVPSDATGGTFTPTNYSITYSSSGSLTVIQSFTPTVSLVSNDADDTFCEDTNVTFTASAGSLGGGSVATYDFKVDGNSAQSGASDTFATSGLTNGQEVTVEITVSGGTCLTTNTATSNAILNNVILNQVWYLDADGDGYGDLNNSTIDCIQPLGYVDNSTDCNDGAFGINPGVTEICFNNIDDDCNGSLYNGCAPVLTNILPTFCGSTLAKAKSTIGASAATYSGPYTVTYLFRITNLTATPQVTVDLPRAFRNFNLGMTNILAYDSQYSVMVAAVVNGEQQPFSAPCLISTPSIPTTKLIQCGGTVPTMTAAIACHAVANVIGYQFEVSLASNPGVVKEFFRLYANFSMQLITAAPSDVPLLYDTDYIVRVKAKVLIDGEEVFGAYGDPCTITTPMAPEAFMVACDEDGISPESLSTSLYASPISYATLYRFTLYNEALDYNEYVEKSFNSFKLSDFEVLNPLTPGETYTITVDAIIYGNYYPGKDCQIVVPFPAKTRWVETPFEAKAYPNPFADNFMVEVASESNAPLSIKVYDMIGRLVDQQVIEMSNLLTSPIGEQYPSGVYNVIITQGEVVKTLRVVKR